MPADVLAMTGAAIYLKRRTLDLIGVFDERFGMAYEDVDLCLRAWDAGLRVTYAPGSTLTHLESKTRPVEPGAARARLAGATSGRSGATGSTTRDVRTPSGGLRIVYVTEDTGIGGGHRVIFQHLNGLLEHGHEAELWTLEKGGDPDWFDLKAPVRTFVDYEALVDGARAARRDQGRDLVEHRRAGLARRRSSTASPPTTCRTSRRSTTPASPSRRRT